MIGLPGASATLPSITLAVISGAIGSRIVASDFAAARTSRVLVGSRMMSLTRCSSMKVLPLRLRTLGAGVASVRIRRRAPPLVRPE